MNKLEKDTHEKEHLKKDSSEKRKTETGTIFKRGDLQKNNFEKDKSEKGVFRKGTI